jgi:hypothetical protein
MKYFEPNTLKWLKFDLQPIQMSYEVFFRIDLILTFRIDLILTQLITCHIILTASVQRYFDSENSLSIVWASSWRVWCFSPQLNFIVEYVKQSIHANTYFWTKLIKVKIFKFSIMVTMDSVNFRLFFIFNTIT